MIASSVVSLECGGATTSTSSSDASSSLSEDDDSDEDVEDDSESDDVEDSASTDRESLDFPRLFFLEVRFFLFFLVVFFFLSFRLTFCDALRGGALATEGVTLSCSLLGDIMWAAAAAILLGCWSGGH